MIKKTKKQERSINKSNTSRSDCHKSYLDAIWWEINQDKRKLKHKHQEHWKTYNDFINQITKKIETTNV